MHPFKICLPQLPARWGSVALLLVMLTGCATVANNPATVQATPPADSLITIDGDYDYFPAYNVYYNRDTHQYVYLEGGYWVSRPTPAGVATNVLRAAPSVRMGFRDAPANHNAEMVRKYPHNWVPPGAPRQLPSAAPDLRSTPDHT